GHLRAHRVLKRGPVLPAVLAKETALLPVSRAQGSPLAQLKHLAIATEQDHLAARPGAQASNPLFRKVPQDDAGEFQARLPACQGGAAQGEKLTVFPCA